MKLLHVVTKDEKISYSVGLAYLERIGYVPCCTDETLTYVLDYYLKKHTIDDLSIIEIESDKVASEIKWEKWKHSMNIYPHIYGTINNDAIFAIRPANSYLLDEHGGVGH